MSYSTVRISRKVLSPKVEDVGAKALEPPLNDGGGLLLETPHPRGWRSGQYAATQGCRDLSAPIRP